MRPVNRLRQHAQIGKNVAPRLPEEENDVLLRFTESIRLRVFGQVYNFRRGEVHKVALAMVGLLLAEECVEPVDAIGQVA
jgi:hypothetical protein